MAIFTYGVALSLAIGENMTIHEAETAVSDLSHVDFMECGLGWEMTGGIIVPESGIFPKSCSIKR